MERREEKGEEEEAPGLVEGREETARGRRGWS
jgi:hypothetical protein